MLGKIAYEAIEKHRAELDKIRTDMWNNPEIAYREYKACDWIAKYMEEAVLLSPTRSAAL